MVAWWKSKKEVRAKLISSRRGGYQMLLEGEKYAQPNYPRGHLLFGKMSKLKHVIKNEVFNRSWYALESGRTPAEVTQLLKKEILPIIFDLAEETRYDRLPPDRLSAPMQELNRAWTKIEERLSPERAARSRALKEIILFILQEDDSYRFRFQWLAGLFNPKAFWRKFTKRKWREDLELVLTWLEHAEVVGDMKERQRLFKRIILMVLEDSEVRESFEMLIEELDWKKLKLSKGDKYYFRGKYFKVDYPYYTY